jgi:hypothetical protein
MPGYGSKFPPKNRPIRSDLGALDIEIADGAGKVLKFDPNGLAVALVKGDLAGELGRPIPKDVIGSAISGEAGYRYSDSEVDFILTREELGRFLVYDLKPNEYFALRAKYGMFFQIHDDFYDEESGQALQPKFGGAAVPPLGRF